MSEQVTIIPSGGHNGDGDALPDGAPLVLIAYEVAPGNTLLSYGIGGDLDSVDYTVFLPLRFRADGIWSALAPKLEKPFDIKVRGRRCKGRAQVWDSRGHGGIAVLAHSSTGKALLAHSRNTEGV
ncbi:hypothetical protein [Mycobacteroides abscessus]|uniref:hypothetical protein n=1 Tax=Mycobacteroides abscessus TaxID=36809 RepID=UPI0005DB200D|nr:hypothetical protein [Mycobacteroides abscessus]CPR79254.1 Uncharacterised protein [Mycobacteroides abscessus]CPR88404.1 Uncharacterised protein [Mycobacteroides abscessus]CPS43334.1 Uncharacterised protein [Mycobacteroides abscessus]CPV03135.1 Uncharacterised protein [Mycobacteroides abscessus]